jgi:hypothetical protein
MEILFGNYCYWLAQSACQDNNAVVYPSLSSAQLYAPQAFAMAGNSLPTCWIGSDLVATGLVPRLNRGGNITGTTTLGLELGPKRLQMLSELLPAGATVALFSNPTNAKAGTERREIQAAAPQPVGPEYGEHKRSGRCLCAHRPA